MPRQSAAVGFRGAGLPEVAEAPRQSAVARTVGLPEVGEVPRQSEEDQDRVGLVEDAGVLYPSAEAESRGRADKARRLSDDQLVRRIFYF